MGRLNGEASREWILFMKFGPSSLQQNRTCSARGPPAERDDQHTEGAPAKETLLAVLDVQPAENCWGWRVVCAASRWRVAQRRTRGKAKAEHARGNEG